MGEPYGRLLDVVARPEGADADAQLIACREAPAVASANVAVVDPQLHLLAVAAGVYLQSTRETGVRRLDWGRVREHAPPAERVHHQRSGQLAPVGLDGAPLAAGHGGGLQLELRTGGLLPKERAQLAVVERGERPRQRPARGAIRGVDDHLLEALAPGVHQIERVHPLRGHRARRSLALAELVAVDHEHPRARAG